jgi:hypothetical protein
MSDQETPSLESLVAILESKGGAPQSADLENFARAISKMFDVNMDEVAILQVVARHKSLKFVLPEKLSMVGSIPLSSTTALAARTARERRPELINNFTTSRHSNVFEAVPLGRDPGDVIQKIMSAPVLEETTALGIVQISRKGRSLSKAGADFSPRDLLTLVSLSPTILRFLKLFPPE